jgi:hypothetical protein
MGDVSLNKKVSTHKKALFAFAFTGLLLWFGYAQALTLSTESDYVVTGYEVALVLHELLLVFWLGPDIGIFVWSTKVANTQLADQIRVTAAGMMHTIDIFPRVCVSLMLTVGGILTEVVGLEHEWWQWVAIILLGPVWLTLVLIAYFREGTSVGELVTRLDIYLRWIVIVSVPLSVAYSTSIGRMDGAPWVSAKLFIFAAIVLLGLLSRRQLDSMQSGIRELAANGASDSVNEKLTGSVRRARPYIFLIWLGLAVAAWLGIEQPGSPQSEVRGTANVSLTHVSTIQAQMTRVRLTDGGDQSWK